jgi:hypothetical protein
MPAEDHTRHEQEEIAEEHSFDVLARSLVDGTISRQRVLKLVGAAILGGALSIFSLPHEAEARRHRHHAGEHRRRQRRRRGPATCAARCKSGCCVGNVCNAGTTNQFCGIGGAACVTCGVGTVCSAGRCVLSAPTCSPTNCSGCCVGTVCSAGTTNNRCGTGGSVCVNCPRGTTCTNGQCV